ncbi:hypothetical protein DFH94DRAFT_250528 [Russula ochroleuca]|uniref:Uncharacterized protein n=1 Tax=Russula ochroleuca TaxID=152965 RepID=A0A9P5N2E6_9AGAM|nr:hypothetical protein DFH94DRAFT_250528 [Russula ochroleuca]
MVASPSSSVLSSSSSSLTPTNSTPSTCTITPATYAAATVSTTPVSSHRPYPLSASAAHASARTTLAGDPDTGAISPRNTSRMPVTPAVLRAIFASSRSPGEERSLSRIAFFRFSGFIISCLAISLMANQGRGIRTGAALLGVGV